MKYEILGFPGSGAWVFSTEGSGGWGVWARQPGQGPGLPLIRPGSHPWIVLSGCPRSLVPVFWNDTSRNANEAWIAGTGTTGLWNGLEREGANPGTRILERVPGAPSWNEAEREQVPGWNGDPVPDPEQEHVPRLERVLWTLD